MKFLIWCRLWLRRWRLERNYRALPKAFQRLQADERRYGKPDSVRPQAVRSLRQLHQTKSAVQAEIDRINRVLKRVA